MADSLVCAIDGETVSFALAGAGDMRLHALRQFSAAEFPTFTDALQHYARSNAVATNELTLGLAVAGIAKGDVVSFANCRWYLSVSGLRAFLRADPLIINDFAATAWSLPSLDESRISRIGPVPLRPIKAGGTYLVIGAGVGLGMATLSVGADGSIAAFESEGGHASFAPQSEADDALLGALRRRFGHVSYERLLSHHGLQYLYTCVAERQGRHVAPAEPSFILASGVRGDPIATETLEIFAGVLGAFAGNGLLAAGAWDGVVLVGDLLGKMLPMLDRSRFRAQMSAKGRMARALERVPTNFAAGEHACLTGAAAALRSRRQA